MQPCSREMQGMNSLLNTSQISLQDLQTNQQQQHSEIQNPAAHFDPSAPASQDDFLEQMLNAMNNPSCSWPDLNPKAAAAPWEQQHQQLTNKQQQHHHASAADMPDETGPSTQFNYDHDQSVILASKLRQHQISGGGAAAAKLLLQQQLMMARGIGDGGVMHMPLHMNGENDVVNGSFKSPNQGGDGTVQALYNGFSGSLHGGSAQAPNQSQHFHHPQGGAMQAAQSFSSPAGSTMNQSQASGSTSGAPQQPRQRVRARRGQATDPHSIAERLRRERIAERMKALQELVPNANKTDKASMLDEIIDYVKFLQLQVKVLSMSRLGGAAAVAPLVADMSSEGGGECTNNTSGGPHRSSSSNGGNSSSSNNNNNDNSLTVTEHQVAKLMEEDMGQAMQYLQGKGLCLMPISLATAISTATCHSRILNNTSTTTTNNPLIQSNGGGDVPTSPSVSALTVQSATVVNGNGGDGSVKDAASVSKP